MSGRISLEPTARSSGSSKSTLVLIPRRGEALASLQNGERLTVRVLEKFAGGKVLLELRGAAVTARAEGDLPVGARLEVTAQRQGQAIVLRRAVGEDPAADAVWRMVRAGLPELETRDAAIAALAERLGLAAPGDIGEEAAALYERFGKMLRGLLDAGEGLGDKLRQWAALAGASPAPVGERLREFFGRDLPALLDRFRTLAAAEVDAVATPTSGGSGLTGGAGALKEQLGFLRAFNGLLAGRDGPSYLALPFAWGGQTHSTELWFYRGRDASRPRVRKDPETSSALIRLRLPEIGEVRALVAVRQRHVQASLHAERPETAELIERALPELSDGLRAAGLTPRLTVGVGVDERPMPSPFELLIAAGEARGLSVKA